MTPETTTDRTFSAHVTVAAIVRNESGQYLFVEEEKEGRRVFNQPAGHLEANEDLIQACERETLEETGYQVRATGVVGIGLFTAPGGAVYHRTTFVCQLEQEVSAGPQDSDIIARHWMTLDEIRTRRDELRSPLVLKAVEQYESGHCYPLSMLYP